STRPDKLPSIIMAGGQTVFLGNAAGAQYVARVFLDLHIWALEDGADTAKAIGFAVCNALKEAPNAAGFGFDEFSLPAVRWMRDPDPDKSYTHGVITVEAVMRWAL
ncbi:tail completion protein gp17, partial [Mesorhizobium sp. A623]